MTDVFSYNATFTPQTLSGTVQVSASGTDIQLSFTQVDSFVVALAPTGNPAQWLVSAIAAPLANIIVVWLSSLAPTLATAIKPFTVASVPDYSIDCGTASVDVTPSNVSITNSGGLVLVTATITLS